MSYFANGCNLRSLIRRTSQYGYAYEHRALAEFARQRLLNEVRDLKFSRDDLRGEVVKQCIWRYSVRLPSERLSTLTSLGNEISYVARKNSDLLPATTEWRPNEATIQAYVGPTDGISPHRDHARHIGLVAVFSLLGKGYIGIVRDRAGNDVVEEFELRPRSLMLMRAPASYGEDASFADRPIHYVMGPPEGEIRLSIGYRMDARPDLPPAYSIDE